jgi:two-component system, OmpR family, response regulator
MSNKYKILILEDDQFISTFLEAKLQENFETKIASSTKEADDILARDKIDLILLDILLPEEDGFSFMRRIKEAKSSYKDIPVLVLSNLDRSEDIEKAKELGAVDYLVKGNFVPEDVARKVAELLKGK